jgi:hypothetical protein
MANGYRVDWKLDERGEQWRAHTHVMSNRPAEIRVYEGLP